MRDAKKIILKTSHTSKKSIQIHALLFVLLKRLYIFAVYNADMLKNSVNNLLNNITIVIVVVVVNIIPALHGGIS